MTLYGLRGFTHHGGRLLTVMSPAGAGAVERHLQPGEGLRTVAARGGLTQYHEIRAGALDALIATHGIEVLERAQWGARKAELGARIYT